MGRYLQAIVTKLREKGVKDLSRESLKKAFSGCVMPNALTNKAQEYVKDGSLTKEMLDTAISVDEDPFYDIPGDEHWFM